MLNNVAGVLGSPLPPAPVAYFESISTNTLGSNQTNITLSSIPSGYKHLQLRYITRNNRASTLDGLYLRFNSDTGANYSDHQVRGDGTSASSAADVSSSLMLASLVPGSTATGNVYGAGVIDILEYANTSIYKTMRSLGGYDTNGGGQMGLYSGNWRSTSAITSITIGSTDGSGLLAGSSFALYGIKG